MVRLLAVDSHRPEPSRIVEAVRVLKDGGLVAFPTETVYGLGARALDNRAVERVFAAKGRPKAHPLIAHVGSLAQAKALAGDWPAAASLLGSAFWPGPLTLVVSRALHFPAGVSGGGDSIAIRVPTHPVARALLSLLDEPIAAPSANRYQGLSPTLASHVVNDLGEAVDLVLDAGPCDEGIESTVVDVRDPIARVLRPGALGLSELRKALRDVQATGETRAAAEPRASPGMDARHYAPRAKLHLAASAQEALRMAGSLASRGTRVGVVTCEDCVSDERLNPSWVVALGSDAKHYARRLYAAMHDLEDAGVSVIVVQEVPAQDDWWAVADRLSRASHE